MSLKETEEKKIFTIEKITYPTTLSSIAKNKNIAINRLLTLNPHIKSENELISDVEIYLPLVQSTYNISKKINEKSQKKKDFVKTNTLIPLLNKIRPKLLEVINKIVLFDRASRKIFNNCRNHDRRIYIHVNLLILKGHSQEKHLFVHSPDDVYRKYQKEIYDKYEKALIKMGMFFRNMVYFYHFIDNRSFFDKQLNNKIKDALVFANNLLNVVLGRINKYLFYILHLYQMLNGSCEDWVIYKNLTILLNVTFGKISSYFSDKGRIDHFLPYSNFLFTFKRSVLRQFHRIISGVNGEKLNDTYIFNYTLNYSEKKKANKINDIRNDLDRGIADISKRLFSNFNEDITKAHTMYMGRFFYNLEKDIDTVLSELQKFLNKYPKATKIGKWPRIKILYKNLKYKIKDTKRLFKEKGEYNQEIQDCIDNLKSLFACYSIAVGLYQLAGFVGKEIDWFESLFVDEENFFKDVRERIDDLINISFETDLIKINTLWSKLQNKLDKYSTWAERLIEKGNYWGGLVREIVIIIIATALTLLSGGAVFGFLSGMGLSSAVVGGATFATEVIVYCLAHEALSSFMEERSFFSGSIKQFGFSLISTAIMFGVFRGVGKMIRNLVEVGFISSKLSVFFATWFATFFTSTLITAPFFAGSLLAHGHNPFSWREWSKFLMTQAILSGILSSTTLVNTQISTIHNKISKTTARLGRKARLHIEKLSIKRHKSTIVQNVKKLTQMRDELEEKYKTIIEFDENTFNDIVGKYNKAINKGKILLKLLKRMRTDLLVLEETFIKDFGGTDIGSHGEIFAIEQFLKQAEVWIDNIQYIPDYKYSVSKKVNAVIPNNNIDGLTLPIGKGKEYYLGRIIKIAQHSAKIKKQLIEGKPLKIIRQEFPLGIDNAQKGRADIQYLIERRGIKDAVKITIFDSDGQGEIPANIVDEPYTALDYKGQKEGNKNSNFDVMNIKIENAVELKDAKRLAKTLLSLHREAISNGAITKPKISIGTRELGGGKFEPHVISFAIYLETGECAFGYPGQTSTTKANETLNLSDWNPSYSKHIDPLLKSWIQKTKRLALRATGKESFEKYWSVENCAEVWAVNKLLKKLRIKGIKNFKPEKIVIQSIEFQGGEKKVPCKNCKITFSECNIKD